MPPVHEKVVGWGEGYREEQAEADMGSTVGSFQRPRGGWARGHQSWGQDLALASQLGLGWSFRSYLFQGERISQLLGEREAEIRESRWRT